MLDNRLGSGAAAAARKTKHDEYLRQHNQERKEVTMRSRVIPALWIAAVLAICCSGTAALAAVDTTTPHLAGTWKGKYSGAFSGTFTLTWTQTGSKLIGSITLSSPKGKYGIVGNLTRTGIKFGAVAVGATYTGSVTGTSMSGHWNSPQGGGTWSAHKMVRKQ
jgi:hypothetical protein